MEVVAGPRRLDLKYLLKIFEVVLLTALETRAVVVALNIPSSYCQQQALARQTSQTMSK
jgi:hypothetical protein